MTPEELKRNGELMIKASKNPDMLISYTIIGNNSTQNIKARDLEWNFSYYYYEEKPEPRINWCKVIEDKVPCLFSDVLDDLTPEKAMVGILVDYTSEDTEPLKVGQEYYAVNLKTDSMIAKYDWENDFIDTMLLKRNLIHLDKESTIIHAKAMLKLNGVINV